MPDIEVIIRKPQASDDNLQTEEAQAGGSGEQLPTKKEKGKKSVGQNAVGAALTQAAIQVMQNGVNQLGNLTGNYTTAKNISNTLAMAGDMYTIYKYGAVGAITVATKHAISIMNSEINQANKRREEDMRRQRAGRIVMRGSRY